MPVCSYGFLARTLHSRSALVSPGSALRSTAMAVESVQAAPLEAASLRALCIARHCFLSEHIARYFARMGVITAEAVGLDAAVEAARGWSPDVVIGDYDLLATIPLEKWERDELLSNTPVIAVSLTRD